MCAAENDGDSPKETIGDSPREIVRRLLQVISRELPMSAARELLDDNLAAYMDGKKISRGRGAWFRWVRFLHFNADKKMRNLAVEISRMECAGGEVVVFARWRGDFGGETKLSDIGEVRYQIRGGKIVSVQTHKRNYIFIYGKNITRRPAFFFLLLRMFFWRPSHSRASGKANAA